MKAQHETESQRRYRLAKEARIFEQGGRSGVVCDWLRNEMGAWDTECDQTFEFTDGGPYANGFRFCPYCGQTLVESLG